MKLQGKNAFITGGNSGIGLATAKLFVDEGAEVIITGRNQETLDEAIKLLGPKAHGFRADVTDSAARKEVFKKIGEQFGKLDIVFANAGIPGSTPAGSTAEELFEQVIRTNLTSVFFTVQDALPILNDGASVILNGSVIGTLGQPGYSAYSASKAGVRALARTLAADLSPRGIRVNVVAPGATRTPIWGRSGSRSQEQLTGLERQLSSVIALGRMGEAEEIAKAVLFLASDDSSYVQAIELFVDGGMTGTPFGGPAGRQS
jgi:NAD(P)-dependent dehydrogenase (short-subunit alcohol dehydrogenase family)